METVHRWRNGRRELQAICQDCIRAEDEAYEDWQATQADLRRDFR